jgi:hypothetical protein
MDVVKMRKQIKGGMMNEEEAKMNRELLNEIKEKRKSARSKAKVEYVQAPPF